MNRLSLSRNKDMFPCVLVGRKSEHERENVLDLNTKRELAIIGR